MTRSEMPELGRRVFEAWRADDEAPAADVSSADDTRLVASIARAIRSGHQVEKRRRALRRWGVVAMACALPLLAAAGWLAVERASSAPATVAAPVEPARNTPALVRVLSGSAVATQAATTTAVSSHGSVGLDERDVLTTSAASEAELQLPRGVVVKIAPSTRLIIERARALDSRLSLQLGSVEVDVPKLDEARRVVVKTPDSEVVVLGTHFVVEVRSVHGASRPTFTSVQVSLGSVAIRHESGKEAMVTAGGTWDSEHPGVQAAASPAGDGSPPAAPPRSAPRKQDRAKSSLPGSAEKLTLENRLFQSALDARNAGDPRQAARLLDELLVRHPQSQLAHEARIERFRLLQRSGDSRAAAQEAQRYLRDYPRGVAADEASQLVQRARQSSE